MDAREKWVKAAETLADQMSFSDSCSLLYSGAKGVNYEAEFMTKRADLFAHLRTTPEGFALVPVERLRQLEDFVPVVSEYIDNYLQDERDEVDLCVCGEDQHSRLVDVFFSRDRLEKSKAPPPKSESL